MKRLLPELRPASLSPLQRSVYGRLCLIFIFTAFLFFIDIFAANVTVQTCHHDDGIGANDQANQSEGWNVSRGEADWTRGGGGNRDPVCSWTGWLCYGQTLFTVGLLLGSLVGGVISDRYGTRAVLLVCVCVHAVCALVPAVLPQLLLFLAVRCLTGVCCCCINICAFSLAVEWASPSARLWPLAFLGFCFSLGTMGGAPLAWLSPTWTRLHLAMALPQLLCLPLFLSIPESPRWLLLKRRMEVLDGYRGNSPADKQCLDMLLDSASSDLQKAADTQMEDGGHAPSDITHLKHPTVLLRLLIMSYLSAATALTYFGICMNIGSFGVGVYWAQFFSGLSEAPCLLVPLVSVGRRCISVLALLLSGAACLVSLLLSRYQAAPAWVMSSVLLGKLCVLAATFISSLYCIELFPTVIRQRCVSLVNLCFRLGCLVNSFVPPTAGGAISLAAMVAYSSGPIVGCALCLLLPETSGVPLPDTVEDCHRQPRPRPPSLSALRRTRKMEDGWKESKKCDTHTTNTHTSESLQLTL